MNKTIKYLHAMSDPALLAFLGNFIQQTRLLQNKTQEQVAKIAGINRSTVFQIENGKGGTLISYIQILRALEQLQILENFEIKQSISPLLLAKMEHKKRRRASSKKMNQIKIPKSDW